MRAHRHGGWRRVLSCVLAYALVLQGLLFALDASRPTIGAATDAVWAGFELCNHSGAGATVPGAPKAPESDGHCVLCVFCLAGVVYVNSAPPATPYSGAVVIGNIPWTFVAPELVAFRVNRNAWPRGPPAAV